jgi:hypothetical protein
MATALSQLQSPTVIRIERDNSKDVDTDERQRFGENPHHLDSTIPISGSCDTKVAAEPLTQSDHDAAAMGEPIDPPLGVRSLSSEMAIGSPIECPSKEDAVALHDQWISDVGGLSKFVDSAALDNTVVAKAAFDILIALLRLPSNMWVCDTLLDECTYTLQPSQANTIYDFDSKLPHSLSEEFRVFLSHVIPQKKLVQCGRKMKGKVQFEPSKILPARKAKTAHI